MSAAARLHVDRIDHVVMAVPDAAAAHESVTKLGLDATPPGPAGDSGAESSVFSVGGTDNRVAVEFLGFSPTERDRLAADPGHADLVRIADGGGGAYLIGFPVDDLAPAREVFAAGSGFDEHVVRVGDEHEIKTLRPRDSTAAGCRFVVLEYPASLVATRESPTSTANDFPLKRIDHLAVVPPDLQAGTQYWNEVLGVAVHADIDAPSVLIRQFEVGDIMVELLQAKGADSPLAGAPAGMRPLIACEVDDVVACVALARERGFTAPDPAPGPLPGTLVSTIDPSQTAGLAIQLLQYR